jgi:hypothetical protein
MGAEKTRLLAYAAVLWASRNVIEEEMTFRNFLGQLYPPPKLSETTNRFCLHVHTHTRARAGVSKSFRTGRLERELQMVQLSSIRWSCIATLWVSLVSFAAITLCVASCCLFRYRFSPETIGYTFVCVCVCVCVFRSVWNRTNVTYMDKDVA